MEIEITEEQDHLLQVAENSALPPLVETGALLPTLFIIHQASEMSYFQFEPDELNALKVEAAEKLKEMETPLAYVLTYGSIIELQDDKDESDCQEVNALILETGDAEAQEAIEFAIPYDMAEQTREPRIVLGQVVSLFYSEE